MILSLPAAAALIAIPVPLAAALFQHGATGRSDILAIGLATAIYGLGLPAFILQKLVQPVFFANEDTKTPFRFAVISMIINAVLAIGLMPWLGWISPAIATTVSAWAMVGMLMRSARQFGSVARLSNDVKSRIIRAGIASVGMAAALFALSFGADPYVQTTLMRVGLAVALMVLGMALYSGLAQMLGAVNFRRLKADLLRRN
jgi:putative peptidoglycan lipid II flippase